MPKLSEVTRLSSEIKTFKELFEHLAYDWGFGDRTNLYKEEDGTFVCNKTYITPTRLSYKTENYDITNPMVFKKLEIFYGLLQETETEKILYNE